MPVRCVDAALSGARSERTPRWGQAPLRQAASTPAQLAEVPVADTAGHAKFYALPFVGAAPSSMMFTVHGFELGMAYTSLITSSMAWQIVQKLVDDHVSTASMSCSSPPAPQTTRGCLPCGGSSGRFLAGQPEHLGPVASSHQEGMAPLLVNGPGNGTVPGIRAYVRADLSDARACPPSARRLSSI